MVNKISTIVDVVSNEKEISHEVVFEAIKAALESATKKRYGADCEFRVDIDPKTGEYETYQIWHVLENVCEVPEGMEIPEGARLTHEEAVEKKADAVIGEIIEEKIESVEFGRIAAQTAKQVIMQKLRSAKRDQMVEEYQARLGELVYGSVKKATRDCIIVELGNNAEALLNRSDMLPREVFRPGDRVRAYLKEVRSEARGPQLFISRTCPEMLIELFKIEVPEIGDGLIEVKGAARDPGSRAKVAVLAKDTRIDPIGACVGMRGSRVQAVSTELGGERVDIVLWDDNPAQYVINCIAPAEVVTLIVDDETKSIDVVVEEDQLSQAIGRSGQNVRLASQLSGWTLNVISTKEAEEREGKESEKIVNLFKDKLALEEEVAIALFEAGFTSLEEVAYVPMAELLETEGLDADSAKEIRQKAKNALLTDAIASEERVGEHEPAKDLLELEGMTKQLAYGLAAKGIVTQEDLAECSIDELVGTEGLDEKTAGGLIMKARAHWFA